MHIGERGYCVGCLSIDVITAVTFYICFTLNSNVCALVWSLLLFNIVCLLSDINYYKNFQFSSFYTFILFQSYSLG